MEFTLTPETREVLTREFISAIKLSGLVLVPSEVGAAGLDVVKQHQQLLKKKYLSPYKIAKAKLLPGVTHLNTIKNMIADGRIDQDEWFKDADGKTQVLSIAIKRLRHE